MNDDKKGNDAVMIGANEKDGSMKNDDNEVDDGLQTNSTR